MKKILAALICVALALSGASAFAQAGETKDLLAQFPFSASKKEVLAQIQALISENTINLAEESADQLVIEKDQGLLFYGYPIKLWIFFEKDRATSVVAIIEWYNGEGIPVDAFIEKEATLAVLREGHGIYAQILQMFSEGQEGPYQGMLEVYDYKNGERDRTSQLFAYPPQLEEGFIPEAMLQMMAIGPDYWLYTYLPGGTAELHTGAAPVGAELYPAWHIILSISSGGDVSQYAEPSEEYRIPDSLGPLIEP